jgi:predicted ATPase
VLGLKISGEISAESVARAVGGQNLLLVVDNCEHVIDAVATLAEMLVRRWPRTTILATSREVLRIEGVHVYCVPPLEVPTVDAKDPDHISGGHPHRTRTARQERFDPLPLVIPQSIPPHRSASQADRL